MSEVTYAEQDFEEAVEGSENEIVDQPCQSKEGTRSCDALY